MYTITIKPVGVNSPEKVKHISNPWYLRLFCLWLGITIARCYGRVKLVQDINDEDTQHVIDGYDRKVLTISVEETPEEPDVQLKTT